VNILCVLVFVCVIERKTETASCGGEEERENGMHSKVHTFFSTQPSAYTCFITHQAGRPLHDHTKYWQGTHMLKPNI
jgi:hypothetical protein